MRSHYGLASSGAFRAGRFGRRSRVRNTCTATMRNATRKPPIERPTSLGSTAGPGSSVVTGTVVVGAVAGAVMGRNMRVDPVVEDTYWRENYATRPYIQNGARYNDYQPAYRYGADTFSRYPDRSFDDVEPELGLGWGSVRGKSSLDWENAKHATRDAWHRLSNAAERAVPGDSDRDGR